MKTGIHSGAFLFKKKCKKYIIQIFRENIDFVPFELVKILEFYDLEQY
jgi:hypothetical protein